MITSIHLQNFKAFESLEQPLRPITLLLGPNNSGKSSILAAVKLLVQTLESHDIDVPLLLNGPLGDFGTFKDVVHGNHRGRPFEIGLSITAHDAPRYIPFEGPVSFNLEYKHRRKRRETILRTAEFWGDGAPAITLEYSFGSERHLIASLANQSVPSALKAPLAEDLHVRHFAPYLAISRRSSGEREGATKLEEFLSQLDPKVLRLPSWISRIIYSQMANIDYIGAMRNPPQRTYLFTGEKRRRIGSQGEHAASLFMLNTMRDRVDDTPFSKKVTNWLSKAGIAEDVRVEALSDRHYELRVEHPKTGEIQNIADVGYGNSQIFPVIVGGYRLESGSAYLIEEPEIHLHPRAQAELGDFLVDLHENQVQTITETHSEYAVLRLQQHIASGQVDPEEVAVYYVHAKGERKRITLLELDEKGRFVHEWPEGFFPERLSEARRLSRLRHDL